MTRVLCCYLALLSFSIAGEARDPHSLKDGVVKVRAGSQTGSGFILDVQETGVFVLTAQHVVEGQQEIEISFLREPHRPVTARVIRNQTDLGDDGLSILHVETDDFRGLLPLNLSQEAQSDPDEPVFALGFYGAGTLPWSVAEGRIIGHSGGPILFSGAIEEGNSGGPLIQNGEIIGVVTQKGAAHNMAVPAKVAEYFAESVIGVLPVRCNAAMIPKKTCQQHYPIDRMSCDYIKRGNELYEEGDYPRAISAYDQAIASKPGYAVLYNNRGVINATNKNFAGAQEDFRKALQIDPDYTVSEVNRSLVEYYDYFFRWAEQKEPPETMGLKFLTTLKDQLVGEKSEPPTVDGLAKTVLQAVGELGQKYTDYLQLENKIQNFEQGDFACYGGDIIAANNELSPALAQLLAGHLTDGSLWGR